MLIHPEQVRLTTVAGAASGNTHSLMGICYEVLVKPTTASTQYDISLTDASGIVVFETTSQTGTLSELTLLPVKDIYTVSIANATANEAFIIKLMIHEE